MTIESGHTHGVRGRALVMGLGLFGGGLGVTRWLALQGWKVLVTDTKSHADLATPIAELHELISRGVVELRLGEHREDDFRDADLVIANVAVPRPWENTFLNAARAHAVPITTEIGLFIERLPAGVITVGVTGSVGKSTTSAMLAEILTQAMTPRAGASALTSGRPRSPRVFYGGNIGVSLLSSLGEIQPGDIIVLELSSAMLHWLAGWSPHVAVVTTFAANHIDWHLTLEHYRASKQQILRSQAPGCVAVLGEDAASWPLQPGVRRITLGRDRRVDRLVIPGVHNQQNAALAVAAACAVVDLTRRQDPSMPELLQDRAIDIVRQFRGLPDRLELVLRTPNPAVSCFNDSKSTTPESSMLAIEAFSEHPGPGHVHLIVGGYDKGSDMRALARACAPLAGVYTIGRTGREIAEGVRSAGGSVIECETLEKAVESAWGRLTDGDVLLLSPACASWDQFANYQERGRRFTELVRARGAHL